MFDINSIQQQGSADIAIVHPITKTPTGAVIIVAGPEHPKRKAILFERQRRMRKLFQKKGQVDMSTDPEDDEAERITDLAACTLGWRGFSADGKELAFSEKAAAELYAKPELSWLRDQVQEAINDRENFIVTSAAG